MIICYDIEFPEMPRNLALLGVQFIIVPTAVAEITIWPAKLIPVRSYENHIFIAYVNRAGREKGILDDNSEISMTFSGQSIVCAPNGVSLLKGVELASNDPECHYVVIDPKNEVFVNDRERNDYLIDRRVDVYKKFLIKEI